MLLKPCLAALGLLGAVLASADAITDEPEVPSPPPTLSASVRASFSDLDVVGLRLVNGRATTALIEVSNREDEPVTLALALGTLSTTAELPADSPPEAGIVRNLTATGYNLVVPAGETRSVAYSFAQDMFPQEVSLRLMALVVDAAGNAYQMVAYEGRTAIVDPPTSFLDPQIIFLYLVLLAASGGTLYFVYKSWIEALFPQTKRSHAPKAAKTVADDAVLSGNESAGGKSYDESWIPDHHMNRPVAKRVKSGTAKKKVVE